MDPLIEGLFKSADGVERWVTCEMPDLSPPVRPDRFSRDEEPKKGEVWPISDKRRFEEFRAENHSGYFLIGKGSYYDVGPHDNPRKVCFYCRSAKRATNFGNEILDSFANCSAVYGFGSSWEEYEARNRYVLHFVGRGRVLGFLGRDFNRYVPGLYWLNYISDRYRKAVPVPWEAIAEQTGRELRKTSNGVVLQLYDKPSDWQQKDEVIKQVIRDTENIFSIEDVEFPAGVKQLDYIHGPELEFEKDWP